MKNTRRKVGYAVLIAVIAVSLFYWQYILFVVEGCTEMLLARVPSDQDRVHAEEIYRTVVSTYNFTRSSDVMPRQAPVFSSASRLVIGAPFGVTIYYVTSAEDQDKIIRALEELCEARNLKSIKVKFYAEENWNWSGPLINTPDGPMHAVGERGPEKMIRSVTIK